MLLVLAAAVELTASIHRCKRLSNNFFLPLHTSLRHPAGTIPLPEEPEGDPCIPLYVLVLFFCTLETVSLPAAGLSSRSRLRGTQGGHVYTRRKAPTGFRGSCSRRSKSRELASNHGISFRRSRAMQDDGSPTFQLFAPLL